MYEINETFGKITLKNISELKKHGYIIIRNLFNSNEVEFLEKACDLKKKGDTLTIDEFQNITLSDKILDIFKMIIPNNIVYPCLSLNRSADSPESEGEANSRVFHVDSIPDDFDYNVEYGIYNSGIYLSDHKKFSGGLKIRPFSINKKLEKTDTIFVRLKNIIKSLIKFNFKSILENLTFPKSINLDTQPGDLIIWSNRCHHSGHFRRLKLFPNISLEPFLENFLPNFLFIKEPQSRRVILTIYADEKSPYLEEYIKIQINKFRRKEHYLKNEILSSNEQTFFKKGIIIRNDGYKYWSSKI
jgi:hypothetical protein